MMKLMQSSRDEWVTEKGFAERCLVVATGKYYGLTQDFIKCTRERFKSGEISYHSAMLMLKEAHSRNIISYIGDEK